MTLFEDDAIGGGCISAVVASDVGMSVGDDGACGRGSVVRNGEENAFLDQGERRSS